MKLNLKNILIFGIVLIFILQGVVMLFPNNPTPVDNNQTNQNQTINNVKHQITLKTSQGDITFETYDNDAPNTVKNFVDLASKKFYDGVIFHRVIKGFMIQGGDPTGTGMGGPGYKFDDELNPATPSYQTGYKKGVVAMANAGPNTNGSQFFIMLEDVPLQKDYTIFGKVISGQEVVDKIGNLPTDKNDRPLAPPKISKVVVESL
jgi:cyclophilin family peptidyl-prolyl cis-trans isomerase